MRTAGIAIGAALLLLPTTMAAQQTTLDEQRERLRAANAASRAAERRSGDLERQAEAANNAASRAAADRAAVAARAQAAEADIAAARARIAIIDRLVAAQRRRLDARRAPTLRLVAAIQSFVRRPAALGLLQPGSTRDAVHVRAVLATVVPVVRARSAGVRAEVERAAALRDRAALAERGLREGRARLEIERLALLDLEAASRLRSRDLGRSALIESDRALAMGEEARDIVDRMAKIDAAGAIRERLLALPGPLPRPETEALAAAASGLPPYMLPVAGRVVTGLGEVSPSGVRSRGLALATARGAAVVAPAPGRVAFARPFPGYGTVVILDHGNGWTSLMSGLATAVVRRGQQLPQGARLGSAPSHDRPVVTVELRRRGRPVDMVPLLD
ncbi:murein hydrolase activator EnvC family protein [Sphingomonas qomolangmaensis]|uniref:Peptidoglycan DD-metalloendopeptidase family protein n=1 Tax=Sphingomonas qomolangmaensis TaxID=2918765 RepID=A0ABY5LB02_9SPHN|nr:peptidoglycan DD-metalloendopeptidase family protein [Sphingomonas qomolangmaensis]UUL81871.1 peptidoglycan DD-metalloendopeptidase family protein [Sphingomonas qomolangmaensis]